MFSGLLFLKNSYMSGEKVKFHTPLCDHAQPPSEPPRATRGAVLGKTVSWPMTVSWAMHLGSHTRPAQRGRFVNLPSALPHKAVADVKGVLVNDRLFLVYDR